VLKDQANSYDLTQATAAARPTWETNELNGLPVIRHASGDILKAATASDWKFMHDGTQFAVYIVWKTTNSNPNTSYGLLDTGAWASGDTGFALTYDDTSGTPRLDQILAWIAKGSAPFIVQANTEDETVRGSEWHITSARFDGSTMKIRNDGQWGGEDDEADSGTPSSGNPTSALAVGGRYDNTSNLVGDWARILIISGAVSDNQHKQIETYLAETYGQFEISYFGSPVVVTHSTGEPDHNAFPGICIAPNGDLIIAYMNESGHANFDGDLVVKRSVNNGDTWGSEEIVWDFSDAGQGNNVTGYGSSLLTVISDNRILMSVGRRDSGGPVVDGIAYFESNDNGTTWTGPTEVDSNFNLYAYEGGGILELANGDLLYPHYGKNSGDTYFATGVSRSQDDGDTWSYLTTIDSPTSNMTEPGLVQLAGGTIICLERFIGSPSPDNDVIYFKTSANNGATWSARGYALIGGGMQRPTLLSTGEIVAPVRSSGTTNYTEFLFGYKDGDLWQTGHQFGFGPNISESGAAMTYGQIAEGPDGILHLVYGSGDSTGDVSDIMYAKT
jgi:hypothetical protein